nr:hypothetical protein [Nostoc mirabile]
MTQSQPPLPQPKLESAGITSDQYFEFTPEKLELSNGYLGYGGQDQLGFHLSVLTNMGLLTAVRHTNLSLWLEALLRCGEGKTTDCQRPTRSSRSNAQSI